MITNELVRILIIKRYIINTLFLYVYLHSFVYFSILDLLIGFIYLF